MARHGRDDFKMARRGWDGVEVARHGCDDFEVARLGYDGVEVAWTRWRRGVDVRKNLDCVVECEARMMGN